MSVRAQVLPKILPDLKGSVFDYSAPTDFEKLWKFDGLPEKRIVIVWTHTAPDPALAPINAADCLSPLDWAAAYVKHLTGSPENWPQILVIDANPQSHLGVPTLAHFNTLRPDQLPWLTVLNHPHLIEVLNWLGTENQLGSNHALDRFLRVIRLNLSTTRMESEAGRSKQFNHHSISNIVSPLILLNREAIEIKGKASLHASALMQLLRACGLAAPKAFPVPHELKSTDLNVLLVDDQAEHGWLQWIQAVFQGSTIRHALSPMSLLNSLKTQWNEKKGKDLRFRFELPGLANDAKNPVLFLDLRLFSEQWTKELDFYDELCRFILTYKAHFCGNKAPWKAIPEERVAVLQEWRKNNPQPESPEHFEAMLLLPKVLALADMALPIILFSSTAKRDLVAPLADCKNIYLGFHKDAVHSEVGLSPLTYLANILPEILSYGEWRRQVWELSQVKALSQAQQESFHWEIYIDESGTQEGNFFRVAGLLVGYRNKEHAEAIHQQMDAAKIRWRNDNDSIHWQEDQTEWLGKPRNNQLANQYFLNEQWTSISARLEELTGGLPKYSFCILKEFNDPNTQNAEAVENPTLTNPHSLDNQFFSLLNDILETCLFDVLGIVCAENQLTVSIFAASRLRVLRDAPPDHYWVKLHRDKYAAFGVSLFLPRRPNSQPSYQALQMDGILPVISELLQKRRSHEMTKKLQNAIILAAAVPMNQPERRDLSEYGYANFDNGVLMSPPFRHLHFVADIMASLASPTDVDANGRTIPKDNYGVMTESSFAFGPDNANKALFARQEGENRGIACLLRISQLLDSQDKNVLLAAWLFRQMRQPASKLVEMGLFARAVLNRLKDGIGNELTGIQLNLLVSPTVDAPTLAIRANAEPHTPPKREKQGYIPPRKQAARIPQQDPKAKPIKQLAESLPQPQSPWDTLNTLPTKVSNSRAGTTPISKDGSAQRAASISHQFSLERVCIQKLEELTTAEMVIAAFSVEGFVVSRVNVEIRKLNNGKCYSLVKLGEQDVHLALEKFGDTGIFVNGLIYTLVRARADKSEIDRGKIFQPTAKEVKNVTSSSTTGSSPVNIIFIPSLPENMRKPAEIRQMMNAHGFDPRISIECDDVMGIVAYLDFSHSNQKAEDALSWLQGSGDWRSKAFFYEGGV